MHIKLKMEINKLKIILQVSFFIINGNEKINNEFERILYLIKILNANNKNSFQIVLLNT